MPYQPKMTNAGLSPIRPVTALDEQGQSRTVQVAGETPLTLFVDDRKIVTLMTLGTYPEALAIGYLRNQQMIKLCEINDVLVNWETETVKVNTFNGGFKFKKGTITSNCGQGAVLSINKLPDINLPNLTIKQSLIYAVLQTLARYNEIHRQAGGVHACALCQGAEILAFVEDVGRHNAVDAIAGLMWLHNWDVYGDDKIFYTTGRLTSEIVMKVAHIGIPILLSRSGVTHKGIQIAQECGMTLIAHAKDQRFLVFNGDKNVIFDA
jgi:FdhD protein